jgi:hypothetical protein
MRNTLIAALSAGADGSQKRKTRRFLHGLSTDELQFIAEFLGSCTLEVSAGAGPADWQEFQRGSEDRELKMILAVEYLGLAGVFGAPARTAGVSRASGFA